ncbi:lipoprotein [Glaesserella parasuis]|nr:lipoprotein [Glaesserella parasuis]
MKKLIFILFLIIIGLTSCGVKGPLYILA